jgi:CO dehydrogenase/acetyl-CoA synthase beta subunit
MRISCECYYYLIQSEGDIMAGKIQLKLKPKTEASAAASAAPAAAPAGAAPAFAMQAASSGGITIELRGASIHVAEVVIKPKK